jgi:hypothetical protein
MVAELKVATLSDDEIEKIHQNFAFRTHILRRISTGKCEEYVQRLLDHEIALKDAFVVFLQQLNSVERNHARIQAGEHALEVEKSAAASALVSPRKDPRIVSEGISMERNAVAEVPRPTQFRDSVTASSTKLNLWANEINFPQIIPSSFNNAFPGLFIMVLYCVAHLSLYELLYAVVTEATKHIVQQHLVYTCLLLTSLLAAFLSGGSSSWMPDDDDGEVKSRHFFWTVRWFKKRPRVKSTVDLCCLYVCFIAVAHFHNQCLAVFDIRKRILDALPSMKQQSPNILTYTMSFGMSQTSKQTCNGNTSLSMIRQLLFTGTEVCSVDQNIPPISSFEDVLTNYLLEEDCMVLWSKLSAASYYAAMGTFEGPLVSPASTMLYYGLCTAISIYLLWRLGYHFWTR